MLGRGCAATLGLVVTGCTRDLPPPKECGDNNDCYINYTRDTLAAIADNINSWDNVNTYAIVIVGVCGIVATVMLALQGDQDFLPLSWCVVVRSAGCAGGCGAITALIGTTSM
jgi:hypothetical protein